VKSVAQTANPSNRLRVNLAQKNAKLSCDMKLAADEEREQDWAERTNVCPFSIGLDSAIAE
jgi:hypothetical protein